MTHTCTMFNVGFMINWHKAKIKKLSKLASHNFLYGILRNVENTAEGFKHYMKIMFSI